MKSALWDSKLRLSYIVVMRAGSRRFPSYSLDSAAVWLVCNKRRTSTLPKYVNQLLHTKSKAAAQAFVWQNKNLRNQLNKGKKKKKKSISEVIYVLLHNPFWHFRLAVYITFPKSMVYRSRAEIQQADRRSNLLSQFV